MGYGADDMWRVWSDLERKEDELKWGGRLSGVGPQFNSMGRPASASAHFNNGWASEQMGRVNRVRKALNDSGPLAKSMIGRTLSGIDLSTIWPILVSACEDIALYYGGSAAAGGLIGGVGGAFFGGVGAVPGAAAGAAAGGYVGGWVLAMLGLQSLVEDAAQAIPEALRYYESGFLEAWGPTRHDHQHGFGMAARGDTSFAALQLANGHVIMISTILTALAAYLTRGKGDMLKDIRQSARLGPQVAIWVEKNEDKLRRHLALQSRGRGASPGAEPPPPKPRREPTKEQERDASGNSARNSTIARDASADNAAKKAIKTIPSVADSAGNKIGSPVYKTISEMNFPLGNLKFSDSMSSDQYKKLVKSIDANGIQNKVITYVEIDGLDYIAIGNNRYMAAQRLGVLDELRFKKSDFPVPGTNWYTTQDILDASGGVKIPKIYPKK